MDSKNSANNRKIQFYKTLDASGTFDFGYEEFEHQEAETKVDSYEARNFRNSARHHLADKGANVLDVVLPDGYVKHIAVSKIPSWENKVLEAPTVPNYSFDYCDADTFAASKEKVSRSTAMGISPSQYDKSYADLWNRGAYLEAKKLLKILTKDGCINFVEDDGVNHFAETLNAILIVLQKEHGSMAGVIPLFRLKNYRKFNELFTEKQTKIRNSFAEKLGRRDLITEYPKNPRSDYPLKQLAQLLRGFCIASTVKTITDKQAKENTKLRKDLVDELKKTIFEEKRTYSLEEEDRKLLDHWNYWKQSKLQEDPLGNPRLDSFLNEVVRENLFLNSRLRKSVELWAKNGDCVLVLNNNFNYNNYVNHSLSPMAVQS